MFMRTYEPYADPEWPPLAHSWPHVDEIEEFEGWLDEMITKQIKELSQQYIKEQENKNDHNK